MTGGGGPLRVLFVCTANTCRSPFMELLARHEAGEALVVSSAGTRARAGLSMSDVMADRLRERGVSPDGFRSRPLTGELVEQADLVLTAEAAHREAVLEAWPAAARRTSTLGRLAASVDPAGDAALDVPDPYRGGPDVAARCAVQIEDLLRAVLPALTGTRMIAPWKT